MPGGDQIPVSHMQGHHFTCSTIIPASLLTFLYHLPCSLFVISECNSFSHLHAHTFLCFIDYLWYGFFELSEHLRHNVTKDIEDLLVLFVFSDIVFTH